MKRGFSDKCSYLQAKIIPNKKKETRLISETAINKDNMLFDFSSEATITINERPNLEIMKGKRNEK